MFHHLIDGETWEVAPSFWANVCFFINLFRASCFIISLMERHERWHLTHGSQWGKIFLWKVPSHCKIGKLVLYTHKGNCDHVVIPDILHVSWMIVPTTEVKPFVLWQLFITLWNFLGEKLGDFFCPTAINVFFLRKKCHFWIFLNHWKENHETAGIRNSKSNCPTIMT